MDRPHRPAIVLGIVFAVSASATGTVATPPREEALAAFAHLHRVATHPRCANCHSGSDQPLNGERTPGPRPHAMNVTRRIQGLGMPCTTCHPMQNLPGKHMPPGAPHWTMPEDRDKAVTGSTSSRALCEMWTDARRNRFESGDRRGQARTPADLLVHVTQDPLVRWAWEPGEGREPAPGTHVQFVERFVVWVAGGAPCP